MEQLRLFEEEKKKKEKKPRPVSDVDKLVMRFHEVRGPLVGNSDWAKARGQAKQVLAHLSIEEALNVLEWMLNADFYKNHSWSICAIGKAAKRYRVSMQEEDKKKSASKELWKQLYKPPEES